MPLQKLKLCSLDCVNRELLCAYISFVSCCLATNYCEEVNWGRYTGRTSNKDSLCTLLVISHCHGNVTDDRYGKQTKLKGALFHNVLCSIML